MSLKKILIVASSITLVAVLYVYQQSKIIEMAYKEQETLASLENEIERKNDLKYHINRQMSLISIAGMWQEGDFEWPHSDQLMSLSSGGQYQEDNKQIPETKSIVGSIFELKSQAEATPIKPQ